MRKAIIFWNGTEFLSINPDKILKEKLGIDNTINILSIRPDKSFIYESESLFVDKELLFSRNQFDFDYSIIKKLEKYESAILRVIDRNLRAKGQRPSYRRLEEIYNNLLKNSYNLLIGNIEFVLFFDIPHHPIDYITYILSEILSIPSFVTRGFAQTHLLVYPRRRYISDRFPFFDQDWLNQMKDLENAPYITDEMKSIIEEYSFFAFNINKYNKVHLGSRLSITEYLWKNLKSIKYYIKNKKLPDRFLDRIKAHFDFLFIQDIYRRVLLRFYDKNTEEYVDFENNYLYFPLHYQPEASSNPLAGSFVNQEIVIDYITSNLPKGYLLYIREHPAYWHRKNSSESILESRSFGFYKRMVMNKNVRLINRNVHNYKLINFSKLVVTLTGTVAFEAFGFNKYALMFGKNVYANLDNALRFPFDKSIPELIDYATTNESSLNERFKVALYIINQKTVHMNSIVKTKENIHSNPLEYEFDYIINYIKQKIDISRMID